MSHFWYHSFIARLFYRIVYAHCLFSVYSPNSAYSILASTPVIPLDFKVSGIFLFVEHPSVLIWLLSEHLTPDHFFPSRIFLEWFLFMSLWVLPCPVCCLLFLLFAFLWDFIFSHLGINVSPLTSLPSCNIIHRAARDLYSFPLLPAQTA